MTAPRLARATDHGRMYARTRGGELVHPSITTVLDVLNPNLEWWEARCAVDTAVQHSGLLHEVVSMPEGPERTKRLKKARAFLEGTAERDRDESARRGDAVHNYAEVLCLHHQGLRTMDDLERERQMCVVEGVEKYLEHVHQFFADFAPKVLQPEATVWNDTIGYAGTTDLICELTIRGQQVTTVADWKTKKALFNARGERKGSDLRDYTGMQLAAAAFAEEVWVPGPAEDGSQDAWKPLEYDIRVGIAVAFGPDGYLVRQYDITTPLMFRSFCALRAAWDFRVHGKRMMSGIMEGPDALRLPPA